MPAREAVDPFAVVVGAGEESTLASVAAEAGLAIADLRRLNPGLQGHPLSDPLPPGTLLRLPPLLEQRGAPHGSYFTIGTTEEALRGLERRLDTLLEEEENTPLPSFPSRKVFSKTERIVSTVRTESERQLARIKEEYKECGERSVLLQFLVDVDPVKQFREDLEKEYDGQRLNLKTLENSNYDLFSKLQRQRENALTEHSLYNVRDESEDFCLTKHTHRWEFTFFTPESSIEVQDSWAVLSCQTLGALLDTFECKNCLPVNMSKNAFIFIGGTFYVDNRHAGIDGENYEDLTAPIRHFQPQKEGLKKEEEELEEKKLNSTNEGKNIAFGHCPVKYVSQTTFADLNVRLGEFGVLRHLGWCNHYFFLSSVDNLRGPDRCKLEKRDYPHRVMKAPTRVVRCRMCRQFPATIACYNDNLSPESPCPYCVPCFELLHATDEGKVEEDNFLTIKLPDGKYFTM